MGYCTFDLQFHPPMTKIKYPLALILSMMFWSCSETNPSTNTTNETAKPFTWLCGQWSNQYQEIIMLEEWQSIHDTLFVGKSITLVHQDTEHVEQVQLIQRANQWYYIPTVMNQNEGQPVEFKITHFDSVSFRAENKMHDFPQIIQYRSITPDSIIATISGNQKGKFQEALFPMKRVSAKTQN
jgi:hypothetical protein